MDDKRSCPASLERPQSTPDPALAGRVIASPLAKNVATQSSVNLSGVKGTGPNDRIIKADVQNILNSNLI